MDEKKQQVISKILSLIKRWDGLSKLIHRGICILGVTAIFGTLFVSTFIGSTEIPNLVLKVMSLVSSGCLAVIAGFNMVTNRNKYRKAWRLLSAKYLAFEAGYIDLEELIHNYEKAEEIIGNLDFSYNKINSSNNGHSSEITTQKKVSK